jgi:hypothetical protein
MEGNTMFSEYVVEEQLCDFWSVDFVVGRDADELLTCAIDDVQDSGVTVGRRELFNEIEGDGMPRSGRYRELLNESERFVSRVLVSFAGDAAVNEIFNVSTYIRPGIISSK